MSNKSIDRVAIIEKMVGSRAVVSCVMGRQVWSVVVEDITHYGGFSAFASVVESSTVHTPFRWRLLALPLYTTSVTAEAASIHHKWYPLRLDLSGWTTGIACEKFGRIDPTAFR
jgi:hypothetical protein